MKWVARGQPKSSWQSRQLPAPSSSTTTSFQPTSRTSPTTALAKATPKTKTKAKPTQRRPRSDFEISSGWTTFNMSEFRVDHLAASELNEVILITEHESPLMAEPQTMAQYAFLNEEVH